MSPDGTTGPFRRSDRLLDSRDFRRVLRRGRRRASRDLVVVTADPWRKPNDSEDLGSGSRLGITISRKVGNAVVRNRFKRRVREWFRAHRDELGADLDLVVIARRPAGRMGLGELDGRLRDLLGLGERPATEASRG
ncbi:MAG: ribonuclease P protein component [bacterium]|nr:ribonuclease P protein component [bacterium]